MICRCTAAHVTDAYDFMYSVDLAYVHVLG